MAPPQLCSPPPAREGSGLGNTQPFSKSLRTGNIDKAGEIQTWGNLWTQGDGSGRVDGTGGMVVK